MVICDRYIIGDVIETEEGPKIAILGLDCCNETPNECIGANGRVRLITAHTLWRWLMWDVDRVCIDGFTYFFFTDFELAELIKWQVEPIQDNYNSNLEVWCINDIMQEALRTMYPYPDPGFQPWYVNEYNLRKTR